MNKKLIDLVTIQKNKINNINNTLDNIILSINNNNFNTEDTFNNFLINIDDIKNYILEIENSIDNLQYYSDISKKNQSEKIKERIKSYEDTRKFLDTFSPLLIMYQMNNIKNNNC